MKWNEFIQSVNVFYQCKKYKLSIWRCPQFLFILMGMVIIAIIIASYVIEIRYIADPRIVALIALFGSIILLIISQLIVKSFERLAEASRMKSEFVGIISHQLRAPLSNLNWAVELLMSGKLGKLEKNQADYLQILKENSSRMQELISDLVTVFKLETANWPFKKEKTSIQDLVRGVASEFRPRAEGLKVRLEIYLEEGLPPVWIDFSQVKQALENLVDNAVRYVADQGRVEVRVKRKRNKVYVEVRDNGVGIPREDQKYIFQKFFRSGNIQKYQVNGSGLGLYIAKSIIERGGGKIGFQSEQNKGSTFWFTLPIFRK